jgi:serine/threonine protein kinase, bacterial
MSVEGTRFGSYLLMSALGEDDRVWRAHDTAKDRDVALTVLPLEATADDRFTRRFQHELRIAADLRDPHVVPIHAFGEIDGRLYVDSALIGGQSLRALLARGPVEAARAVDIVEQIASALDAAHARGLVHHDVEPAQVLLDSSGVAYLGGFGVSVGAGASPYSAPERLVSGAGDDRSDVYSLASLFYETLTGTTPFPDDGESAAAPRPSDDRAGVPVAFDAVIAKGMARNPADRYSSPGALARAARAALTSAPEPVDPGAPVPAVAPPKPVRRGLFGWSRKKLLVAGLATVGIVAMVGTTAAALLMPFLMGTDQASPQRTALPLPTTTTPAPYIAPLAVRPVGRALVPQGDQCKPGPPPPPAPAEAPATTCDVENKAFYELGPVGVELTLTGANAIKLPMDRFYAVQLVMDPASSARFGQYTGSQIGKQVAFVRDGVVLAAPAISAPINGESLQLSGEMTKETADTIARMLREGA